MPRLVRLASVHVAVLSVVVSAAADSNVPLIEAAMRGDIETVRTLLEGRVDENASAPDGSTALHWAVHRDHVQIVDLLLRARARVDPANDYGVTPLTLAC